MRHLNQSASGAAEQKYLRCVLSLGCSHRKTARSSRHALDQLTKIQMEHHWHHWYRTLEDSIMHNTSNVHYTGRAVGLGAARRYRFVPLLFRVRGFSKLFEILLTSACNTAGGVDEALAWSGTLGSAFTRFSPALDYEVQLDSTDLSALLRLVCDTEVSARRSRDELEALCILLDAAD